MDKHLQINLCQKICAYFKPAKNEEISCEGFNVIERLLRNGKAIVFDEPVTGYADGTRKMLVRDVCAVCPFYESDCDFILQELFPSLGDNEKKTPQPCGGFIFLAHLLERGCIKIDDIRNIL